MDDDKRKRNLTILALVLTGAAALSGYRWWASAGGPIVPETRTVSDFIVNWQCLNCQERREDRAGKGPRPCEKCSQDQMYTTIQWACPQHGARPVFMQYNQQGKPTEFRFKQGEWTPAMTPEGGWNIRCPSCNSRMIPAEAARPAD